MTSEGRRCESRFPLEGFHAANGSHRNRLQRRQLICPLSTTMRAARSCLPVIKTEIITLRS